MPPRRRRDPAEVDAAVEAVLRAVDAGDAPGRADLALAVRGLAERLAERAPGRHVEVRVPPFAAVQCVEGPRHTRGTPPNVVEAQPVPFVLLCAGLLAWADAVADGRVLTWGDRADLSPWLPFG
ncbi:MAG TPA: sterol carrier family protein [Mycobacteriales bacterium]|nr:sterol carrier family protein [Mycobacteriales bacterium]